MNKIVTFFKTLTVVKKLYEFLSKRDLEESVTTLKREIVELETRVVEIEEELNKN